MKAIPIDGLQITDEASFHRVFADAFGFPDFHGRNWDAWIDCMSSLDAPESGMSSVSVAPGELILICVSHASELKASCPKVWLAFLECAAFVNWRRIEQRSPPLLAIAADA